MDLWSPVLLGATCMSFLCRHRDCILLINKISCDWLSRLRHGTPMAKSGFARGEWFVSVWVGLVKVLTQGICSFVLSAQLWAQHRTGAGTQPQECNSVHDNVSPAARRPVV